MEDKAPTTTPQRALALNPAAAPSRCCTPARGCALPPAPALWRSGRVQVAEDAVPVPGGRALVGTDAPQIALDGEGPLRTVRLEPFLMGATAVTNAQFHDFVAASGHRTEAERYGWSYVFWADVPERLGPTEGVMGAEWWRKVEGATWRTPFGPGSEAACRSDHPVVHVAWSDAAAYAAFVGGELASEAQWEHAARGGLGAVRFPWGDAEPDEAAFTPCNIWQGRFPHHNTGADGFLGTAPARAFAPNGYGLYAMAGNVWEWTRDPFRVRSLSRRAKARAASMGGHKVSKGGSFLCHRSYCYRYRIAARSGTDPHSTTQHQGFRVVWPA